MKIKFTLFISALVFLSTLSKAQLAGYTYVQSINVSNTSTVSAVDYQLRLTLNTQTFIAVSQMLPSCADIRFGKTCSGSTLYNYWIETGINTSTTIVWVKIDSIPAGGNRTFFMFYGNPAATAVSSIPLVFIPGGSATDSVTGGATGGVDNSQRGFRFSPNTDILVTSFGKKEPTGTTRYVTLFDNTSTNIITQQQVSGPAATYTYAPLSNPIWLATDSQYVIQLFQGVSDGYYFGTSSQINPLLTYYDMRYCNTCTQNTFPTSTLSGYHYGYPDLWFYYKNSITPAPTYTLMGNARPTVTAVSSTTLLCTGQTATLTAGGASTYTWSTTATTASIVISPTVTTSYTVIGTATNGCANIAVSTQSVTTCAGGIAEVSSNRSGLIVYPNPNNGSFVIEPNNTTKQTVQIYDVTGKLVLTQTINGKTTIDAGSLNEGIYNISLLNNEGVINKKLVIVR